MPSASVCYFWSKIWILQSSARHLGPYQCDLQPPTSFQKLPHTYVQNYVHSKKMPWGSNGNKTQLTVQHETVITLFKDMFKMCQCLHRFFNLNRKKSKKWTWLVWSQPIKDRTSLDDKQLAVFFAVGASLEKHIVHEHSGKMAIFERWNAFASCFQIWKLAGITGQKMSRLTENRPYKMNL